MQYEILMFWDDGAQMWGVQVPDLPGCSAQGTSVAQAEKNAGEAIQKYIFDSKAKGHGVPAPSGHLLKAVHVDLDTPPASVSPGRQESGDPPMLHIARQPSTATIVFEQATLDGFGVPDPLPLNLVQPSGIDTVA